MKHIPTLCSSHTEIKKVMIPSLPNIARDMITTGSDYEGRIESIVLSNMAQHKQVRLLGRDYYHLILLLHF